MDTETSQMQDHDFGGSWVDIGAYSPSNQHSLNEFTGFAYGSPPIMPIEPSYSSSMPQPYNTQHLLPLTMSSQWPSMLSTQPGYTPLPVAPMPMPPVAPLQPARTPQVSTSPTPRRTLTDADRRRMCVYHQENPHVKQTEIGAMFGVERSTVSKVLRQKEKYLFPDDGRRSPAKRPKGKFPDIERALSNWVRNHQRQGGELSDAMIREKAVFFANTVGSPDGHQKILTSVWLEKFKQKNCLRKSPSRKGSIDPSKGLDGAGNLPSTQTPSVLSPVSPPGTTTPSPVSPKQPNPRARKESIKNTPELKHSPSLAHDTTPISSTMAPSESNIIFSNENPFATPNQIGLGVNTTRPRSQTLPVMGTDLNSFDNNEASEVLPLRTVFHEPISTSVIEEEEGTHSAEPPPIKRNHSTPAINTNPMQPPPLPKSKSTSPVNSPTSPTQDECRQALDLVVNYFQTQPFDVAAQAYMIIGKLMEKLEIAQNQVSAAPTPSLVPLAPLPTTAASSTAIKAKYAIDGHKSGPRVSKKRSIHTL